MRHFAGLSTSCSFPNSSRKRDGKECSPRLHNLRVIAGKITGTISGWVEGMIAGGITGVVTRELDLRGDTPEIHYLRAISLPTTCTIREISREISQIRDIPREIRPRDVATDAAGLGGMRKRQSGAIDNGGVRKN